MLSLILNLIFAALIFYLVIWAIGYIGIPEPFAKVIKVILVVVAVIFLVEMLLPFVNGGHAVLFK
jgi:ABC-type multidrug transport system permease subunit